MKRTGILDEIARTENILDNFCADPRKYSIILQEKNNGRIFINFYETHTHGFP